VPPCPFMISDNINMYFMIYYGLEPYCQCFRRTCWFHVQEVHHTNCENPEDFSGIWKIFLYLW